MQLLPPMYFIFKDRIMLFIKKLLQKDNFYCGVCGAKLKTYTVLQQGEQHLIISALGRVDCINKCNCKLIIEYVSYKN